MWSYSGNPLSSPKDEVRFLIGDTDKGDPLLQDEEIEYQIAYTGNSTTGNFLAAAYCADAIAARFSRVSDESVGDLHISYNLRFKQFQEMSQTLRNRSTVQKVKAWIGGASISEKTSVHLEPDRTQTAIRIGGMDNTVGSVSQDVGSENDPPSGP